MPKNFYSLVALTTSFAAKSLATDVACKTVKNEAVSQFTSDTFIVQWLQLKANRNQQTWSLHYRINNTVPCLISCLLFASEKSAFHTKRFPSAVFPLTRPSHFANGFSV